MFRNTIQERDYFVAWILFAICNALGSLVTSTMVAALVGKFLFPHHVDFKIIMFAISGGGFVASLPVSYFFFRLFVSRLCFRIGTVSARVPSLPVNAA